MPLSKMKSTNLQKLKSKKIVLLFLGIGCIYGLVVRYTEFRVPCLFYFITGWYCPGCGITRMIENLMYGRIQQAYECNPFLFVTIPLIGIFYLLGKSHFMQRGKWKKILHAAMILYVILLLLWGILRNVL